jgi:hypothetical protein
MRDTQTHRQHGDRIGPLSLLQNNECRLKRACRQAKIKRPKYIHQVRAQNFMKQQLNTDSVFYGCERYLLYHAKITINRATANDADFLFGPMKD